MHKVHKTFEIFQNSHTFSDWDGGNSASEISEADTLLTTGGVLLSISSEDDSIGEVRGEGGLRVTTWGLGGGGGKGGVMDPESAGGAGGGKGGGSGGGAWGSWGCCD